MNLTLIVNDIVFYFEVKQDKKLDNIFLEYIRNKHRYQGGMVDIWLVCHLYFPELNSILDKYKKHTVLIFNLINANESLALNTNYIGIMEEELKRNVCYTIFMDEIKSEFDKIISEYEKQD